MPNFNQQLPRNPSGFQNRVRSPASALPSQYVSARPLNHGQDQRQRQTKMVGGYTLQSRLGSGSFATVFRAYRPENINDVVAVKAISTDKLTKKVLENLESEISILKTFRHKNIVGLQHSVVKTERHIYLILEYCDGGDLQHLIRSRKSGRLTERLVRRLMKDLSDGLKFIWGKDLIHRDIKPQNLLLTGPLPLDELNDPCKLESDEVYRQRRNFNSSQFHLKIADFGFARHLERASLAETLCGSPLYMAPEILQHQSYDAKADIWSAGTVLFEMIAGKPPFNGENHMDLLRNIQRKAVRLPPRVEVSNECVQLLRCTLNRIPISRASFEQFFEASDRFVALGHGGPPDVLEEANLFNSQDSEQMSQHMEDGSGNKFLQSTGFSSKASNAVPIPNQNSSSLLSQGDDHALNKVTPPLYTTAPINLPPAPSNRNPLHKQSLTSHFSPLSPSPPGPGIVPRHQYRNAIPQQTGTYRPAFTLGGDSHFTQSDQTNDKRNLKSSNTKVSQPDEEFVMVEHGVVPVNPSVSCVGLKQKWNPSQPPPYLYGQHQNCIPSNWDNGRYLAVSGDSMMKSGARGISKGGHRILGTSPGTGGALMAMMVDRDRGHDKIPSTVSTHRPSLSFSQIGASGGAQSGSFDLAAKMLAAAEDVGRRSVNVAHLGDTRAYLAMKMMLDVTRTDDDIDIEADSFNNKEGILPVVSETEMEVEEMPFAQEMYTSESPPSLVSTASSTRQSPFMDGCSDFSSKSSRTTIQAHFVEALSCYVKALTLMKGAVGASQRVRDVLSNANRICPDKDLIHRCELSLRWLGDQFKGILERAEAANTKVQEGKSNEVAGCTSVIPVVVEELIYNHALKCGKDGAVKQLLGQYSAARSCYRSAGLLTEVLLMEQLLSEEDRKVLEVYVDEFSDRLMELDEILSNEETLKTGGMILNSKKPLQT